MLRQALQAIRRGVQKRVVKTGQIGEPMHLSKLLEIFRKNGRIAFWAFWPNFDYFSENRDFTKSIKN